MIIEKHIKKVEIPEDHFQIVKGYAKKIEFGGISSVYTDHEERMRYLEENQLTGQLGEYGGCVALYDFEKYIEKQEQEVKKGDGDEGTDIVGAKIPIDIKTSNVKVGTENWGKVLGARHLMVTPREYSPNMIYVACVVLDTPRHTDKIGNVYVIGWCWGRNLREEQWTERPNDRYPNGRNKSGFRLKYGKLKPLHTLNWKDMLEH